MRLFLIINVTEAGSSESVLKKLIIEYSWRKRCRCLGNIESDIRIKTFFRICLGKETEKVPRNIFGYEVSTKLKETFGRYI